MELRRTHSSQSRELRQSRKDRTPRVTAHPGFMSISPRSSSVNSNYSFPKSEESKRSSTPSGFQNIVAPASSHLLVSGNQISTGSKSSSKPSTSKSFPVKKHENVQKSSRFHDKCSPQNDQSKTRKLGSSCTKIHSKPLSPSSDEMEQTNSQSHYSYQYQINVLKEKYAKLKEDYNAKVEEVSASRVELESAIREAVERHKRCEKAEQKAADLLLRVKEAEFEKIKYSSSRDRLVEVENQLALSRQKQNETIEDAEEVKKILDQQLEAVENTRQLYLETEQLAEEQKRKLAILELENERLSEQIALSMDQAREQFQLQVFELGPLAESVARLNESIIVNKEKKSVADKKAEKLRIEIAQLTAKNQELKSMLSELSDKFSIIDMEKSMLRETIDNKQEERAAAKAENYTIRAKIKDLEELNSDKEVKIQLKENEVRDLAARLETLREECARQISSNKNALVSARKSNLKRLSALEKDLAKTKANENTAEKERDEIRLRLEEQISSLSRNLVQAQEKIKTLQDSLGFISKDRDIKVRRFSGPLPKQRKSR